MALTTTTLSGAYTSGGSSLTVAEATNIAIGNIVRVDDEQMLVTSAYVAGSTTVPVNPGQGGTACANHASGANVTFGAPSDTAWASVGASSVIPYPLAGRTRRMTSYSAAGAIALPDPGTDKTAIINGTTILAMTVAAPGKQQDGSLLYIASNGAAAHTVTFTGGLSGAGSSYDVLTFNAGAPVLVVVMAVNGNWMAPCSPAMTGTVTNLVGGIA